MSSTECFPLSLIMDYRQYRRIRLLAHSCCNYDSGNCPALDDGAECVCVQNISYIASLASLISLKYYLRTEKAQTGKYMAVFSAVNFGLLAVLLAAFLINP